MPPYPSLLSPLLGLGVLFLSAGVSSVDERQPGAPSAGSELHATPVNCSNGCDSGSVSENATHSSSTDAPQNNLFTEPDVSLHRLKPGDQSFSPMLPIPENSVILEPNGSSNATSRTDSSLSTGEETPSNSSFIPPNAQVSSPRNGTTDTHLEKKVETNNTLTNVTSTATLPITAAPTTAPTPLTTTVAPPTTDMPTTPLTTAATLPTTATPPTTTTTTPPTTAAPLTTTAAPPTTTAVPPPPPTTASKTSPTSTTESKPPRVPITVKTSSTPATKRPSSSPTPTPSAIQTNASTAAIGHHAKPVAPETKVAVVVVTGADLTQQLVDTATLLAVLLFGLLFFLVTVAIFVTQAYESYRTKDYTQVDYLINGMYTDTGV